MSACKDCYMLSTREWKMKKARNIVSYCFFVSFKHIATTGFGFLTVASHSS